MSAAAPIPVNPALAPGLAPAKAGQGEKQFLPSQSFAQALKNASGPDALHFSRHALERVQRRNIPLDPSTLARLQEGVGRAAGKGSRDSLVLVDGTAFVVSVSNRTVVTAVGAQNMREHVFTNLDSAVIA
jgi:flagellar operon protein